MGGYEDAQLNELCGQFYRLLELAEDYKNSIQRNVEATKTSAHPNREQRLILLGAQLREAEVFIDNLRTTIADSVIKMVDSAGGPWNQKQFAP